MNFLKTRGLRLNNRVSFIVMVLFVTMYSYAVSFPSSYILFLEDYYCDACGCSANGGSLGMGGVIDNNFVGVRYLYQKYQSKESSLLDASKIDEHFNTIQIWSRIPIFKNTEVQVFIPFHFHSREYVNKTTSIKGLGDISILANYTLLNKKKGGFIEKKDKIYTINHLLKVGLGIKLPTGTYNNTINNLVNPSFQLGTGSVDYITNLQYVFKYNNLGITSYLNYYLKTTNDENYKFGNQFNFNNTFFYVFKDEESNSFVPFLGVSGEFYNKNKQYNLEIKDTEGHAIFSSIGIEYNTPKLTFGALGMFPINQNLSQRKIKTKYRTGIYVNYNF